MTRVGRACVRQGDPATDAFRDVPADSPRLVFVSSQDRLLLVSELFREFRLPTPIASDGAGVALTGGRRALRSHEGEWWALGPGFVQCLQDGVGGLGSRDAVPAIDDEEGDAADAVRPGLRLVGAHCVGVAI